MGSLIPCADKAVDKPGNRRGHLAMEIRIEFLNEAGRWEMLSECSMEFLPMHKDRTLSGNTRGGGSTSFRAIAIDNGQFLDLWHSDDK